MVYAIARRDVPEQRMVSVRERLATADMPAFIGRAYGELYGYLGRSGVTPGGEPFVIYHSFGPDAVDAEVCVPVTRRGCTDRSDRGPGLARRGRRGDAPRRAV